MDGPDGRGQRACTKLSTPDEEAAIQLSSDIYHVAECDVSGSATAGIATFSRFPFSSNAWSLFGTAVTHCMGGAPTYNAYWGRLTGTITMGAASLVIGNTHIPNPGSVYYPSGYANWGTASYYFGLNTVSAMISSSSTFILAGDLNASPPGSGNYSFSGYESSPYTVRVADGVADGQSYNAIGCCPPATQWNDHILWKTSSNIQIVPVDSYFRAWAPDPPLSDHEAWVTSFQIR